MNKIKANLNNLKNAIEKFPLTIITIFIMSVIYTCYNYNHLIPDWLRNLTEFGTLFAIATFLIESLNIKDITKKVITYFAGAVVSFIFTYLLNNVISEKMYIIIRIVISLYLSIIVLAVYFNYKKSNKTLEEYVSKLFINICKTGLIYGVLAAGVALISSIFVYLILNNSKYFFIVRMEILLIGTYLAPTILYSFYNVENNASKFAKVIIKYILDTLVIIAFAIIYIYIAKIIILRDIPSNQIFRILASLFVIGLPIWTMSMYFEDDGVLSKINKKLPLLFIPFILLQIYSIEIRIINNGITEARYLCMMLILFEIIYIFLYLTKKKKIEYMFFILIGIILISGIIPYINMFNASELSQYNNLKIYKQKTEYTKKDREKIYGAYNYLRYSDNGKKYINKLLTEEDEKEIQSYREKVIIDYYEYLNAYGDYEYIDITGYNKLYKIREVYTGEGCSSRDIQLYIEGTGRKINVDLSKEIDNYINNKDNLDDYFKNNYEVYINNGKVVLTDLSIKYNKYNQEKLVYSITGYYLEK